MKSLDSIHHIAIPVSNIQDAVEWYTQKFACEILYQDASWAMLGFNNIQLALVLPEQHPSHIALTHLNAEEFGPLTTHRDGIRSCYIKDIAKNAIEIIDSKSLPTNQDRS